MLAVVRDRAIHHAADQFHVALLFRFDRPCHECQRVLRATLNCAGLRRALTADLSVYGARGRSIRDATLGPSKDRRVLAQCARQAGKVPEPGKGTDRTEGRERDPPRVLDRATPTQLVSAHGADLSPTRPLGGPWHDLSPVPARESRRCEVLRGVWQPARADMRPVWRPAVPDCEVLLGMCTSDKRNCTR